MSIGSLGAAMGLGQSLFGLLSRINSPGATSAASAPADEFGGCSNTSAPPASGANTTATGPSKAQVSSEILALLVKLQQQTGSSAASTSTSISTLSASTSIATSSDPLSQLMAAMDTDGDGEISQTEMESYVQTKLGGTTAQADALFAGLNNGGTGNLTATQLQNDLQQANGGVHGHHGHHHHHGASADQVGNDLVKAMDSDGDGSVSQSEFETFVTGLGGTTSQADADFASLDPGNTGSVGATAFANAVTALQSSAGAGQSPVLNLLDAFRSSATTAAGSAVSVTA